MNLFGVHVCLGLLLLLALDLVYRNEETGHVDQLEFQVSEFFNLVRIKTEGVNGMLPNLDLVNTISFVAMRNLGIATNFLPLRHLEYKELLYNTLQMAWNQILGIPTGPHALLQVIII